MYKNLNILFDGQSKLSNYKDISLIDSSTPHTIFKDEKCFCHLNISKINVTMICGSPNLIEDFQKPIIIFHKGSKSIINNFMFSPKSHRNLLNFEDIHENGYHIKKIDKINLEYILVSPRISLDRHVL